MKEATTTVVLDKVAAAFAVATQVNKELFDEVYQTVKLKKTRDDNAKALRKAFKEGITSVHQRKLAERVLKMALNFVGVNRSVNYKMIDWDNLKAVTDFHKTAGEDFGQYFKSPYKKGMSDVEYNNALAETLKEAKEKYKEDHLVVKKVTYDAALKTVDSLNDEDKVALYEYLSGLFALKKAA